MQDIKDKYERSIIKLGNSKAITFPQEWANKAKLKEKSMVNLYPIDEKTLIVRVFDEEKQKVVFNLNPKEWPAQLIKQAILSAFKLNTDEIIIKYDDDNQGSLYELLIDLRREIIGFDFKDVPGKGEFCVNFLLDSSKTLFPDVLMDLANVFRTIIQNIISGNPNKNSPLLLDEIDRKYSLGTRILITGLAEFPISKRKSPTIRFLGDRVVLLYVREFINQALNFQVSDIKAINKFKDVFTSIPELLIEVIKYYNSITLDNVTQFHEYLEGLHSKLKQIKVGDDQILIQIRNLIQYYLNSFMNFFDIGITRLIESEIGMV